MLTNLKISYKLMTMVVVAVAGILVTVGVGLSVLKTNLLEDRKAKLQDVVTVAIQALEADYQNSKKSGLSDSEAEVRGKALLRSFRFGNNDYVYAFAPDGVLASHPNAEGKNLYDAVDSDGLHFARLQIEAAQRGGGFISYHFPRASGGDPLPKISYAVEFKPYHWAVAAGIYIDDVDAIFRAEVLRMGTIFGAAVLLVLAASLWIGRSIVKPITAMTQAMRKIAAGDTATTIPAQTRRDEVGMMAQSVQVFKDNMIEAERLRGEQDELKAHSETERKQLMLKMASDFEAGVSGSLTMLSSAACQMRMTSEDMTSTAHTTSSQATSVAAAAEQASANVQTVAVATE